MVEPPRRPLRAAPRWDTPAAVRVCFTLTCVALIAWPERHIQVGRYQKHEVRYILNHDFEMSFQYVESMSSSVYPAPNIWNLHELARHCGIRESSLYLLPIAQRPGHVMHRDRSISGFLEALGE